MSVISVSIKKLKVYKVYYCNFNSVAVFFCYIYESGFSAMNVIKFVRSKNKLCIGEELNSFAEVHKYEFYINDHKTFYNCTVIVAKIYLSGLTADMS